MTRLAVDAACAVAVYAASLVAELAARRTFPGPDEREDLAVRRGRELAEEAAR